MLQNKRGVAVEVTSTPTGRTTERSSDEITCSHFGQF